jgi:DNA polymerase-3 subunit delta'
MKYIDQMELHEIVAAIKQINKYRLEITDYLDIMTIWYRDILLYKATADMEGLVFGDQIKFIKEKAKRSSYEGIERILTAIETAKTRIKANVNFDLLMELLLLTIKEN